MTIEEAALPGGFARTSWTRLRFLLLLAAAALSPAAHDRTARARTARAICHAAGRPLASWLALSFLLAMALTRLVAAAAEQYALSHLALEAVVRVYVVEVVPLAAAVFVALRSGVQTIDRWAHWRRAHPGRWPAWARLVPEAIANAFAVALLALANAVVSLLAAYLVVHGATPWAFAPFSGLIARVFEPLSASALLLRLVFFAAIVGLMPFSVLSISPRQTAGAAMLRTLAKVLAAVAVVELVFLFVRLR